MAAWRGQVCHIACNVLKWLVGVVTRQIIVSIVMSAKQVYLSTWEFFRFADRILDNRLESHR